jgi:glutathione peroxidase
MAPTGADLHLYMTSDLDMTDAITLTALDGSAATLADYAGQALLVVNVASKCGFTKQYAGLEALHERYRDRGFTVLGFPSNQFGAQEPGTAEEIAEFCSLNFGVTFPLFAKTDVNGPDRHPLFARLTEAADAKGEAGDVQWNFEKFLVAPSGAVVGRFRSRTEPEAPELVAAIEAVLPR